MTEYGKQCLKDYIHAITRAERLLREAEHDIFMVEETQDLYNVSCHLREAMLKIQEGMSQSLYEAQESE